MIKKFSVIFLLLSLVSIFAFGQITDGEKTLRTQEADTVQGWKKGGVFTLNFAQTSLTNWSAGGQNSFAVNGLLSAFANYKKGKSQWVNSLDLGYGILKQGSSAPQKTDDKFDFLSKYGYQAFKNIYYAALLNFRTQMAPGYKYPDTDNKISDIFAPAYLLVAAGLDYKPNDHFSTFIAPLTGKITIVNSPSLSEAGAFGVTPGNKSFSEFGGYVRAIYTRNDFKTEFLKNVTFTSKIDLFSNYAKNPQNIVVNWETLIAFKVNKFISASINTQLVYDDKIKVPVTKNGENKMVGSLVQFKEILGVGFSYKF
jgi:hypothetical protein